MPDTSTHLLLPYLLAAQAQKHVTVNEALRLLDGLVQLAVLDRHLTAPPASPADGARYIVASGATGAWAGWDLNVAYRVDGAWMRLVPRPGWQAWVVDEASFLAWDGSAWSAAGLPAFFSDAVFELAHDADPSRRAVFDLAAIAAGAVRSFALPDVSTELAGLSGAQTFDGDKTFAGELEASGPVATIGTAPGTATYGLGTGATASGATKTVNLGTGGAAGSDTVVNIGSDTPGADGTTVVNTPTVTFANGVTVVGMPQANLTALLLGLGGAVADAWNRLSVNTPAVLLNNAGAGIEATVNKAAPGNDAAFAFKTGFSARALIGLLGSDDFSFKVSPDGSAYHEAILVDRNTGRVELPKPAVLPAASSAPAAPAAGKLALYARTRAGQPWLDVMRPNGRDFPLQPHLGCQPRRHLVAVVGGDDHRRGHAADPGRDGLDAGPFGRLARQQHAPLAADLGGDGELGGRPAQRRDHLLARQRRRARRLDLRGADLARHPAGDRDGVLRSLPARRGRWRRRSRSAPSSAASASASSAARTRAGSSSATTRAARRRSSTWARASPSPPAAC